MEAEKANTDTPPITLPAVARAQRTINKYELQSAANLPLIRPRRALVAGFIYDTDTMFLYAQPGGFKSMVAINLAVAVANGGTFMTKQASQARVLYVDGELSQYTFSQRLALFGEAAELDILSECYQDPKKLHELEPIYIEKQGEKAGPHERRKLGDQGARLRGWQSELLTLVEANDYRLVIFDNIRTLTDGIDENDAAAITPLNNLVKRLRHLGCAVLVVHHTRKTEGTDSEPVYAGSTNFLTVYNTAVGLQPVGPSGIQFHVVKDREHSIDDYFKERSWKLSGTQGVGFEEFDGFSVAVLQMQALVAAIVAGEFPTRGSIYKAARGRFGITFNNGKGDFVGLHAKLASEAVVPQEQAAFEKIVADGIDKARSAPGAVLAGITNNNNTEEF